MRWLAVTLAYKACQGWDRKSPALGAITVQPAQTQAYITLMETALTPTNSRNYSNPLYFQRRRIQPRCQRRPVRNLEIQRCQEPTATLISMACSLWLPAYITSTALPSAGE